MRFSKPARRSIVSSEAVSSRPIILTLQLDAKSVAFFEAKRRKHFPPDINFVPAHLTLFHQLSGGDFEHILKIVGRACAAQPLFSIKIARLLLLGRGVAYGVQSETLVRFRDGLARDFAGKLKGQDREEFCPHITIQNKVSLQAAAALHAHLSEGFEPFEAEAQGVQLWFYEGVSAKSARWTPAGAIGISDAH